MEPTSISLEKERKFEEIWNTFKSMGIQNRKSHQKKIELNVRLFCLHFIRSRKILFVIPIFHFSKRHIPFPVVCALYFSSFHFFFVQRRCCVILLLFHFKTIKIPFPVHYLCRLFSSPQIILIFSLLSIWLGV